MNPSIKHNFDIVEDFFRPTTLNLGYDYASIMHYDPTAFAKPGTVTLVATKPNITFGHAKELSLLDIAKANALYKCGML